jgi:tetratricopeptide (TPR) repeat protein
MRRNGKICRLLLACLLGPIAHQAWGQASPAGSTGQAAPGVSRQERDDYRAAPVSGSGAALDKAAGEFAAKYPESRLRRYLYLRALRQYQAENDPAGMLSAAREVLAIDSDDPVALVLTATVLADQFSPADPDREQKIAQIRTDAESAIRNLAHRAVPSSAVPDQSALYRSTLQAMAYSAMGVVKLKTGDDAGAEKDLKTAATMIKARPDPYVWYHLALAQDHRRKFSSAISSIEQAMQLASANPQLQHLAEREHDRLLRLAGRKQGSSEPEGERPPE